MSQDDEQTLGEVQRMQKRMDRLFNDMMPNVRWMTVSQHKAWRPPTDVYETDDSVIVKVEVAGMSEEDFAISLSNRTLSVSGIRRDPEEKLAYQQLEIPYGHFQTEIFLPYSVVYDEISAQYENGFLTVVLPKVKKHHIQIMDRAARDQQAE
jgi:HSP20 family protein